MADDADFAAWSEQQFRERALAAVRTARGKRVVSETCLDCGEPVELARRAAVATCLCAECAAETELRRRVRR